MRSSASCILCREAGSDANAMPGRWSVLNYYCGFPGRRQALLPPGPLPPTPALKPPEGFWGGLITYRKAPTPGKGAGWAPGLYPKLWPRRRVDNGVGGEGEQIESFVLPRGGSR